MILRELIAKFGLDFDASSFARADTAVNQLKGAATRLVQVLAAGLIARELRDMVTGAIEAGASIDDMSKKTGVAASAIQELRYAAKLSGLEFAQLDKGLVIVSKLAGDAAAGNTEAAKSFAQYGVSIRDASGHLKTGDVLMAEISDRMKASTSDVERLTIATTFFGAKNSAMTILLREGSAELAKMRQEAVDLGYVMSQEMIDKAAILDDNFDRLRMAGAGFRNTLAGELFPALQRVTDSMIAWLKVNRVWLAQKVKEKIDQFVRGLRVAWSVIRAVRDVLNAMISIVGGVQNALILLGVAFGVRLVAQIGAAILATGAFNASQLLARTIMLGNALLVGAAFIALAAVIVLLGEEIAANFTSTEGFFERMRGKWGELRAKLWEGMSLDDNPLVLLLKGIGLVISHVFSQLDFFFDMIFRGWNVVFDLFENGGVYIEAFAMQVRKAVGEVIDNIKSMISLIPDRLRNSIHLDVLDRASLKVSNGQGSEYMRPSPAVAAAAMSKQNATSTIAVNVDASGQSFDEEKLSSLIEAKMTDAMDVANAQTLQSLTPEFAE